MRAVSNLYLRVLPRALFGFRRYLVFAAVLFVTCVIVGYRGFSDSSGSLPWIFRSLVRLKEVLESVTPGWRVVILFWNNLKVTLISLAFGWILGIVPILGIAVNGVLIGAGAKLLVVRGTMPLHVVALGLLPHGLFELPAFLIGQAMGLRIGLFAPVVWAGRASRADLGRIVAESAAILVLVVVPLLAVAALMELGVSPSVLRLLTRGLSDLPF
ncbi:MAG: stage II sporulation protein M [Firmicutes bacterium]|nr:stage II sporulation protein M [Bacillota bacterium]